MECFVEGRKVPSSILARRELNFSQPVSPKTIAVPFKIILPFEEFAEKTADVFSNAAEEEKADAPFHKTGEWPIMDCWRELGYPPPGELLKKKPGVLAGLIRECFDTETLDRFVPGPPSGLPKFLLNSIDEVEFHDGWIHLEGRAFLHPKWTEESNQSISSTEKN